MAITAGSIIDQAAENLADPQHEHWSESELLTYLSMGQRALVQIRPEAYIVTSNITVVPGVKQTLPDDGFLLWDVVRNLGTASEPVEGRGIRPISRNDMDQIDSGWPGASAEDEAINFMHDVNNRKTFYVYPKLNDGCRLEISYTATPPSVTNVNSNITLDDMYDAALLEYVMYRARSKDMDVQGQSYSSAKEHLQNFVLLLTGNIEQQEVDRQGRQEKMGIPTEG